MRIGNKHFDYIFLFLLIAIIIGLPYGIWTYDRQVWYNKL